MDLGPASFDVTHNWRFNWLYRLPNMQSNHPLAGLVKGWWLGNIVSLNSGLSFHPLLNSNRSRSGVNNASGGFDRPDLVPGVDIKGVTSGVSRGCGTGPNAIQAGTPVGTPDLWFDPCAFQLQEPGFLGNLGRGVLRGPSRVGVDLSINKDTPLKWLGEQGTLQFRFETFNLLNRANFRLPSSVTTFAGTAIGSGQIENPQANVGVINSTATTSRQLQLAIRIGF
jgi:hypothetical protein